jgi:hypothetical protein
VSYTQDASPGIGSSNFIDGVAVLRPYQNKGTYYEKNYLLGSDHRNDGGKRLRKQYRTDKGQ